MNTKRLLACGLLAAALAFAPSAHAQYSPSNHWVYNLHQLHENDLRTLGRQLVPMSSRGAMALVFADGTAPITDQQEVRRWVETGRPLRAVAYPGISGDAIAAVSLAKDVAIANHANDGANAPVLAVNSGWTDSFAPMGHALEAQGLIPSIGRGEGFAQGPSHEVAEMLRKRLQVTREPIGLVGHSAGCFYAANTAWLLDEKDRKALRIYNVGVATRLPSGVKAVQRIGTTDVLGLVNSTHAGLGDRGTRVEAGLSHLAGSDKTWMFGDSSSTHAWHIESFADAFSGKRAPKDKPHPGRELSLRQLSGELGEKIPAAEALAERHDSVTGVSQMLGLRLRHDANALRLRQQRAFALAEIVAARKEQNDVKLAAARQLLLENRRLRTEQNAALRDAQVRKNVGTDGVDYAVMFGNEALASMDPIRMWHKTILGIHLPLMFGQHVALAVSEAMMSPVRPVPSDRERAASLTDEHLNVRRSSPATRRILPALPATTTRTARRPVTAR